MMSYPSQHTSKTTSATPEEVVLAECEHIKRHLAARGRRTKVRYSLRSDFIPLALLLSDFGVNAGEKLAILADWRRSPRKAALLSSRLRLVNVGYAFQLRLKLMTV
jgi:hypothetical protein